MARGRARVFLARLQFFLFLTSIELFSLYILLFNSEFYSWVYVVISVLYNNGVWYILVMMRQGGVLFNFNLNHIYGYKQSALPYWQSNLSNPSKWQTLVSSAFIFRKPVPAEVDKLFDIRTKEPRTRRCWSESNLTQPHSVGRGQVSSSSSTQGDGSGSRH